MADAKTKVAQAEASQSTPTGEDVSLRKADGDVNCGVCMNWGSDNKCELLKIPTTINQVCDMFTPLEAEPEALPAETAMPAEAGAAPAGGIDLAQLFG